MNDLGTLATNYGAGSAQAFADFQTLMVPEPSMLALLALVLPALRSTRRSAPAGE